MSPLERLLAEREQRNKRIANWLTAVLLIIVAVLVTVAVVFYHPERKDSGCFCYPTSTQVSGASK